MKVLVTGAAGMLGADACVVFADKHSVYGLDKKALDVSNHQDVFDVVEKIEPDVIVHLAAWTNVDECQCDPYRAYRINTLGTQNVVLGCQRQGIPLVYLSTISVFDGTKPEPYNEFDTANPQSVYSKSKYYGEQAVQSLLNRYYIVRAGWMFGGGGRDKKFVARILQLARESRELRVVDDKFGSPTYTLDLAHSLSRLIETELYGVYHMVNPGGAPSRFEVARLVLECAQITDCELIPVPSSEFPLPAPRPRMEAGHNLRLELLGVDWMRPWSEALSDYVAGFVVPE